jgi:hypothetical protein
MPVCGTITHIFVLNSVNVYRIDLTMLFFSCCFFRSIVWRCITIYVNHSLLCVAFLTCCFPDTNGFSCVEKLLLIYRLINDNSLSKWSFVRLETTTWINAAYIMPLNALGHSATWPAKIKLNHLNKQSSIGIMSYGNEYKLLFSTLLIEPLA